jgi:hypothetical protein
MNGLGSLGSSSFPPPIFGVHPPSSSDSLSNGDDLEIIRMVGSVSARDSRIGRATPGGREGAIDAGEDGGELSSTSSESDGGAETEL